MATFIRLAEDIEPRLDFLVLQTGRSKAFYLREIIEHDIEVWEDYPLAANVLESTRKGKKPMHSTSDVRKSLEME